MPRLYAQQEIETGYASKAWQVFHQYNIDRMLGASCLSTLGTQRAILGP